MPSKDAVFEHRQSWPNMTRIQLSKQALLSEAATNALNDSSEARQDQI